MPQFAVRAIHIDHQLQATSVAWREHCVRHCAALGISIVCEQVELDRRFPEGVEAAARAARYEAFRRHLQPGEVLLTAHHADDQLETVLLALVRGSGLAGLSAMPVIRSFAAGWHMRPLLEFTRDAVSSWAHSAKLRWINDPSNDHLRFDRNYLRNELLPGLRQRWPAVARSVSRSAAHLAEARELLEAQADADLQRAAVERCLDMRVVRELTSERRRNLLRRWLAGQGARMPSTRKLTALEHDILTAHADRIPEGRWDTIEVHRHGEFLYCDIARESPASSLITLWTTSKPLLLPCDLGELSLRPAIGVGLALGTLPAELSVRFRSGGERIRLAGHAQRTPLKNLLQEAHVLPWWRNRLPLLYAGSELVAVADLWTAAQFSAAPGEQSVQIAWTPRPITDAVITRARP
jgi:tRNA(Ile)-lysidine synthase